MGAYNKDGVLRRVLDAARERAGKDKKSQNEAGVSNESTQPSRESRTSSSDANGDAAKSQALPAETASDMAPFPLNRMFISQPVLTSKFQEHIWKLVIEDGMSVREVSATVSVEMSRVAAVVRLLEIEKEWKRIVRIFFSLFRPTYSTTL